MCRGLAATDHCKRWAGALSRSAQPCLYPHLQLRLERVFALGLLVLGQITYLAPFDEGAASRHLRVRVEIMGPGKYEHVGKYQSVLIMVNPMIFTRTRTDNTHAHT
jgi:hypothetical protein